MHLATRSWLTVLLIAARVGSIARAESADELLKRASAALDKGQAAQAIAYLDQAVTLDPNKVPSYLLRGKAHEAQGQHAEAVRDFDKVLELSPRTAEAYDRRGSEQFKLGHIAQALKDYDKFLELRPAERAGHWRRGTVCYYAGQFDEGRKQFEAYQTIDGNDVENAVWCFLCKARLEGVGKARESLLNIGNDRRVPMMQVYALFRGNAKPDEVLAEARSGMPSDQQLKERLFYAHLYLALYHEATGKGKQSLAHIVQAVDQHFDGHYMWDVARVHRDLRLKEKESK